MTKLSIFRDGFEDNEGAGTLEYQTSGLCVGSWGEGWGQRGGGDMDSSKLKA